MNKHITLIIIIVAVGAYLTGRYFAPNKIEEKIVYKDRTEYIDRDIVKTEVITKDGETKIVTEIKERIKEVEKEKEIVKFDSKKWIAGINLGIDKEADKYIDLNISRKIIGNIYISGGLTSNINLQIVHLGLKYAW